MRIRLLKDYAPPGEGRPRLRDELLIVPDERGREMIAQGMAVSCDDEPQKHPDSETDQHE